MNKDSQLGQGLSPREIFKILEQQLEQFRHIQQQAQFLIRFIITALTIIAAVSFTDIVKIRKSISAPAENVPLNPIGSNDIAILIKQEGVGLSLLLGLLAGTFLMSSIYHVWKIQSDIAMKPALGAERILKRPHKHLFSQDFRVSWVEHNNTSLFRANSHLRNARTDLGYTVVALVGGIVLYLMAVSGNVSTLFWAFLVHTLVVIYVSVTQFGDFLRWIRSDSLLDPIKDDIREMQESEKNTKIQAGQMIIDSLFTFVSITIVLIWALSVVATFLK